MANQVATHARIPQGTRCTKAIGASAAHVAYKAGAANAAPQPVNADGDGPSKHRVAVTSQAKAACAATSKARTKPEPTDRGDVLMVRKGWDSGLKGLGNVPRPVGVGLL